MEVVIKILSIALTSAVKFLPTPFLAIGAGFSFWECILITSSGGIVGTWTFYLLSGFLMKRAAEKRLKSKKPKKNFTRFNKIALWMKAKIGVLGIAFLTPVIFSIPVGTIIATKFFHKNKWVPWILCSSVFFWSFLLTFLSIGIW